MNEKSKHLIRATHNEIEQQIQIIEERLIHKKREIIELSRQITELEAKPKKEKPSTKTVITLICCLLTALAGIAIVAALLAIPLSWTMHVGWLPAFAALYIIFAICCLRISIDYQSEKEKRA